MARTTTPWRYITHKSDGRPTRIKKRFLRWAWRHKLIDRKREPTMRERYQAGEDFPERPGEP